MLTGLFAFLFSVCCFGAETTSTLAIADAGVQQSEDAPFVTTDYQFLPGEYVYVTFHVAGYSVKIESEKETRSMDVTYTVTPQDTKGVPLASAISGEVKDQLGSEDKNWTPVKRASFLLPSFVTGGEYRVHITASDVAAKSEASKDIPFRIGGPQFEPSEGISVQHFRFLREEGAREALETPAYAPGDTIFTTFDMFGFALKNDKEYNLAYGVTVLRPDGKPFLEQPDAARLQNESFYPAHYLPGVLNVITQKTSPKGEYTILLTVRDLIGNKTVSTRRTFSLE
jgi:hypothetical protein